ncbi:MAG: penicillin-binding transpeptidase domain-containing protein [Candidatus Merdivicinus sp.]|jgi:stage V sporulation protein D (sporulation-specific penicillin-binding protein)
MADGANKKWKLRTVVMCSLMVLFLGWVIANLVYRSLVTGEELRAAAADQQLRDVSITANRGTIYDCNMNVLAQSATVWDVVLSPKDFYAAQEELKDEEGNPASSAQKEDYEQTLINGLSEILEVEPSSIEEHLTHTESMYRVLKRKVVKSVADEVESFAADNDIAGIYLMVNTKRFYPYDDLASSVIGFTNYDNQGVYGIEAYYDETLSGTPGRQISAKDAFGKKMDAAYEQYYPAQDGNSLVLTIDQVAQHYLEKALDATIAQHAPQEGAAGIVMDLNTGGILAMSSKPGFDLNNPQVIWDETLAAQIASMPEGEAKEEATAVAREKQWKNKAVTDIYEPGSVFKVVTASAALEEGTASLNSTYNCTGSVMVPGWPRPIHCHDHSGHGLQTFTEAVVNSCNPAFIAIGNSLGADRFFKYFDAFGLTEKTGIDLPAEAQNSYYTAERLTAVSLASCSFGQSNTVTPIQMLTAAAAAVNGGKLLTPHIVSKVLDADGNVVEEYGTEVRRQVISEETSEAMCLALEQVVAANGGSNAYVKGYRIGGKSGTAQKLNKEEEVYIFSYFVFAPVDDPQVAALVLVDEATSGAEYANTVVAPTVASLMADLLPYLGIQPQYSEEEAKLQDISVPGGLIGTDPLTAQSKLRVKGLESTIIGEGKTVVSMYPASGTKVAANSNIIIYTDDRAAETTTVPDVVGLTPSQANQKLTNAGLNIRITGGAAQNSKAKVSSQDTEAGATVAKGTVVTIECLIEGEDGD